MVRRIFRRICRQPLTAVATLLFAAVLTVILCFLHRVRTEEQKSFAESYASVSVFFKITDFDGSRVTDPKGISGWMTELLTDRGLKPNLAPYVKELHVRTSYSDKAFRLRTVWDEHLGDYREETVGAVTVTGISSTLVAEELTEGWGGSIHWFEGYDESILKTDAFVILVPEELKDEPEIEIRFEYKYEADLKAVEREVVRTFQTVGYFTDLGNGGFYCPHGAVEWVYAKLGRSKIIEEIGAILSDNEKLPELRQVASCWFAEPNATGEPTPWGKYDFDYYFYALDIDDSLLRNLEADMLSSIWLNRLASGLVFALSAGAGFLTGFLTVRARKREIGLMRTLGASEPLIGLELTLEQLLCVGLGIALGGSYSLWQPPGQLLLFGGVYFAGLTGAMLLFLRANLLTAIKEDE